TGTDAIERDAGATELDREPSGEPDDAVLRGDVRRVVRSSAEAFGRGDVDDASLTVALQVGQARLDQQDVGGEVDIEGAVPRLEVRRSALLERRADGDP